MPEGRTDKLRPVFVMMPPSEQMVMLEICDPMLGIGKEKAAGITQDVQRATCKIIDVGVGKSNLLFGFD
ncbi:hypothetical protein C5167_014450 [Papaver somniferum]|uniref:Uncharacterized protein n=1 Tax=Papaver somniferum TaxID=3469 RepID=A0A4Y7J390_PAPSO|nr:hypothetical protein C5167_014450 [Papaver somniferum]